MQKSYLLSLPCLLFFVLQITITKAQNYRFQLGGGAGVSNYLGDIGGKYVPRRDYFYDLRLSYTAFSANAHAKYALTPRSNVGLAINYGRLAAEDSITPNPVRRARNLSFRNNIFEIASTLDFDLYESYNAGRNTQYRVDYSLYLTLGFAYFRHNPQALFNGNLQNKSNGEVYVYDGWHDLAPLKTEGQETPYKLGGFATIVGLGMEFSLERNYKMGWQISVRTTNTDYLDDISTTYDMSKFKDDKDGTLAQFLADRATVGGEDFDRTGFARGNSKYDDAYVFSTLYFAWVFKGKGQKYQKQFHNGYIRKKGRRLNVNRFFDWGSG